MTDEVPSRSCEEADPGDASGERGGEQSALQVRAAFLENWDWELINGLNRAACERGHAQHGHNSETHEEVRNQWGQWRQEELTLEALLDFLRRCHRDAPFLFFNGNTFAEVARRTVDVLLAEFPRSRRREAASLAAHYVAGVIDKEAVMNGFASLTTPADFQPGDRVKTLKGSLHGVVRSLLEDGRVAWLPDGTEAELVALPESLVKEEE